MFDRDVDYPTAVASYDDEGVDAAIDWCCEYMEDGDTLTVWTSLKSHLRNCLELEQLVNQRSNVEHVTGRGGEFIRGNGPVLMAWADMDDIGKLMQYGGRRIRALCIITWNEDAIRPWVSGVRPTVLGDGSAWGGLDARARACRRRGDEEPHLDGQSQQHHLGRLREGYGREQPAGTT